MAQGLIEYPGLERINRASVSWGHGQTPSVFTVFVAPQRALPRETGTLLLSYGRQRIWFPDCKIDQVTFSTDGANMIAVSILDRRWKWQFGTISGHYNIRNPDGTVRGFLNGNDRRALVNSERTPQELAQLCLEAMGEINYDVGDLPNNTRPMVEWEGDNPASALADLCEQLGCRIIPQLNTTRTVIRRLNTGGSLPNIGFIHRREGTIDPAEMPDELRVWCAPTYYQSDLRLEAVAEEPDGTLVPLDEVSYAPVGGWELADIPEFNSIADQTLRNLAKRSVFRYFRPSMPALAPGWGEVESLEQLLPLNDVMVDAVRDGNGILSPKPAVLFGVWTSENGESENQATELTPLGWDQDETCVKDFSIDAERGLIITADYVYKLVGSIPDLTFGHPDLVFRSACTVRDPATMAYQRYERVLPNRGQRFGTGPRLLKHEDIRLTYRSEWQWKNDGTPTGRYDPVGITTNQRQVDAEADYYLNEEAKIYNTSQAETTVFSGLWPIDLDGTIQRVSYNVGAPFASTTVERGRDPGTKDTIPYRLMRSLEKMKGAQDLQRKLQPRNLRDRARRAGGK